MAAKLLAFHEQQIANFRQGIEMMETGVLGTGEVDGAGRRTDTTTQTLECYRHILAELEQLASKIQATDATPS
jgi:hypothetical protein